MRLRRQKLVLFIPIATLCLALSAHAQPQTATKSPSQPASQSQPQSGSQAQQQMEVVPGAPQESLAEAARKAKAQKAKSSKAKVMTNDDVSSLSGHGVSVVGDANSGSSESGDTPNSAPSGAAQSGDNNERYWRGRAKQIMDQISATDRQIASVKAEIAKAGPTSFDPSTGLAQGVIIVHDRNAEVKQLEERKASLDKQLDDLADEGRKAGADSSWFR
ncbi:MAG: hypothetical protein WBP79_03735 [Candidatus Acidiferrales bacterium]